MGLKPCRAIEISAVSVLIALLVGCGGEQQPAATAEEESPGVAATVPRNEAAPGASVFLISPVNGATVSSPVTVKFGVSGIAIQPAGAGVENSGHHHLLIDTELADPNLPVPSDAQHLHFGKGQTETSLELEPGEHRLQLVLGDTNHVPHVNPIMSKPITITVE